jgi:hypothetical protein
MAWRAAGSCFGGSQVVVSSGGMGSSGLLVSCSSTPENNRFARQGWNYTGQHGLETLHRLFVGQPSVRLMLAICPADANLCFCAFMDMFVCSLVT